ncbi:MAG: hypothetical protein WA800_10125, partial [Terriglobales bacterium]
MKLRLWLIILISVMALAVCAATAAASSKDKDKDKKEHEKQSIDSGSFGVFMSGHRVGTEKFSIDQTNTGSIIKSEF